ncbi:MAG: hypothetical protein QM831_25365 [Kofleriaceae bacterium]
MIRTLRCPRLELLLLLALASSAHADDELDPRTQQLADSLHAEARPHFVAGMKAFGAKDYKTARTELETAYKLDPEVPLLYIWAQAERLDGNCPHAVELYQKYLYSDINKAQADAARNWIKECGGTANTSKPADPAPRPPKIDPDPIEIDQPSRYAFYKDPIGDAAVGVGVVAAAIGIVYFVKAGNAADAADSAMFLDDHLQLRNDAIHDRNIGIGLTIAGGVLVGAGIGVYLWHSHEANAHVATDGRSVALAIRW